MSIPRTYDPIAKHRTNERYRAQLKEADWAAVNIPRVARLLAIFERPPHREESR